MKKGDIVIQKNEPHQPIWERKVKLLYEDFDDGLPVWHCLILNGKFKGKYTTIPR